MSFMVLLLMLLLLLLLILMSFLLSLFSVSECVSGLERTDFSEVFSAG